MAAIRSQLRNQGYDDCTVELTSQPQRDSTAGLYDKQWDAFVQYCESRGWIAHRVSLIQLAEYLCALFDRRLAPATIQVHRAAISSVITTSHYSPSEDDVIRSLIKRFHRDRPRMERVVPD